MSPRFVTDAAARLNAAAAELAPRLLPGGRHAGNYWQAGDALGAPGKSLYVQLSGPNAGKWRDAATGEHGDLLDLIQYQKRCSMREAARTGLEMLGDPAIAGAVEQDRAHRPPKSHPDTRKAVAALWGRSMAITGTHAAAYLAARGIDANTIAGAEDLRFLPEARTKEDGKTFVLPAMLAAVRNPAGEITSQITGLHRTFLSATEAKKANIEDPKKALGQLHGGGAWLSRGSAEGGCLVVAEGIETALSVKMAFPAVALVAALTAPHLELINIPDHYRRIAIAADPDMAGMRAARALASRLASQDERGQGRTVRIISPAEGEGDFNDLLMRGGTTAIRRRVRSQMKSS